MEQEVAALDIEVEDQQLARVVRAGSCVPAGRAKITIATGAAKSVMPEGMLSNEPAVEGAAKRSGAKRVAANGAMMDDVGETKNTFKRDGARGVNGSTCHVTDVTTPLAAVSRILDKGNRVVFSRGAEWSYVENAKIGEWMPLREERGTFVREVDWLKPESYLTKWPSRRT